MGKVNSSLHICKRMGNTGRKEFGLNNPEVSSPKILFLDLKLFLYLGNIGGTEA